MNELKAKKIFEEAQKNLRNSNMMKQEICG